MADCYLYMGGCEARLGDMGKAWEYLMAALEISSKAGITDNIPKVNDIVIKSIIKPTLDKEIIIKLKIQAERLKRSNPRIIARVKKLLEMYAQAQKKKDNDSATIYAEEIVKLKELDRVILKSQHSLEKVVIGLEAVKEFGDVMGVLGPGLNIVQRVQGELKDVVPEIAGILAKVDEMLDTLLTETGTLSGETIDISAFDEEARKVIQEAHEATSQLMKTSFPELPDDIKFHEKSNAIS